MILTGENRSTWRGTSPNVTSFLLEKNNSLKIFYIAILNKKYILKNCHIFINNNHKNELEILLSNLTAFSSKY